VNRVDISLLVGIDRSRDTLMENTLMFARGTAANNVLLWGARGMGKSSLVKAAHAEANRHVGGLKLVAVHRALAERVARGGRSAVSVVLR